MTPLPRQVVGEAPREQAGVPVDRRHGGHGDKLQRVLQLDAHHAGARL